VTFVWHVVTIHVNRFKNPNLGMKGINLWNGDAFQNWFSNFYDFHLWKALGIHIAHIGFAMPSSAKNRTLWSKMRFIVLCSTHIFEWMIGAQQLYTTCAQQLYTTCAQHKTRGMGPITWVLLQLCTNCAQLLCKKLFRIFAPCHKAYLHDFWETSGDLRHKKI
jgi:hypothetical protein